MTTRIIPSSGEPLPIIGLGTWQRFDRDRVDLPRLREVIDVLHRTGGRVIDTSPMYGRAEERVGDVLQSAPDAGNTFVATKVWTRGREEGIEQMNRSLCLLRRPAIDLMQIHNLVDWPAHLPTLRRWKEEGRIRYIGLTHYSCSAHAALETLMRREPVDFVQINYSAGEPEAAQRILPLAADLGIAVLINRPFGEGDLLRSLQGRAIPAEAKEQGFGSWNELLLGFVLAHPAVTCVIPGTGDPAHMLSNGGVGRRTFHDPQLGEKIRRWLNA